VGQAVVRGLISPSGFSRVTWTPVNASEFPGGLSQVADALIQQKTWVAVTSTLPFSLPGTFAITDKCVVNGGATARLQSSYVSPNASYNGTDAITVYADEARNENA
jgi:hypothetical protein